MGANLDYQTVEGKTLQAAFTSAVEDARYESGSDGYSGTIAEAGGIVSCGEGQELFDAAVKSGADDPVDLLIDFIFEGEGENLAEKYGPARAILVRKGCWIVYGMYSS